MAEQKVLVPYNFNVSEEKALAFVINNFANRKDAKVTLFNTYTPLPEIDVTANPEMKKMREALASISKDIQEKETGLKFARDYLLDNGFSEDQVDYVFKERKKSIADEIVVCAFRGKYDVLVLSRQPGKVSRLFARSVHNKVLSALKDVTICIAN